MLEERHLPQDPEVEKEIPKWINELQGKNKAKRLMARGALIRAGVLAMPALIELLNSAYPQIRVEAVRALALIKNPLAAPSLVQSLKDDDHDVRWASMRGLIMMGRGSLEPLLKALTKDFDSSWMRLGAHHVLNDLKKHNQLMQPSLNVIKALEGVEPEMTVPVAAEEALESLFGPERDGQV